MKLLKVSFDESMVEQSERLLSAERCLPAIEKVIESRYQKYDSLYASVNLSFDESLKNSLCKHAKELRDSNPAMLIVIGIGGSNLGAKAVQEACLGTYQHQSDMCVRYVDTVDTDLVAGILEQAENLLQAGRTIIINIVTKSGTTTETIANSAIFIDLLNKYFHDNYGDYIIVTTDTGSKLFDIACTLHWRVLEVPPMVGGRYSIFSAVGLLPLALMGVDIQALLHGAKHMVESCTKLDLKTNIAAQSAAVIYELYKRGFVINNFFPFSVDLHALGLWYRQLSAESLGKECSLDGQRVNIGITPMVSIGSTDLHSIVELHLGGPKNTLTTFIDVAQPRTNLSVPHCQPLENLVPDIQGKSLSTIMQALLGGTKKSYQAAQRPFIAVTLENKSEESIGQFMQWKMIETIYLGHLFNINPFIQPHVESYKKETRTLLARKPKD